MTFNGKKLQKRDADGALHEIEDDEEQNIYQAAYDNVIYNDSTDDGIESEIFDPTVHSDDELEAEVDRVMDRLEFLATIANFWRIAAMAS